MLRINNKTEQECWQAIAAAIKPMLQQQWFGMRSEREALLQTYRWIAYRLSMGEER